MKRNYKLIVINSTVRFDEMATIFNAIYDSNEELHVDNLIELTGYNKNKVSSHLNVLSYLGFVKKSKTIKKNDLGNLIHQHDPFFENDGTLWLMHYLLASNESLIVWNRTFNKFHVDNRFTLEEAIRDYNDIKQEVSDYTYNYQVRKQIRWTFDIYINQQFSKLELVKKEEKKYSIAKNPPIDDLILLAACLAFKDKRFNKSTTIDIGELCNSKNSPGRLLFCDEFLIRNSLERLKNNNIISIESRADLDQIRTTEDLKLIKILEKYYGKEA